MKNLSLFFLSFAAFFACIACTHESSEVIGEPQPLQVYAGVGPVTKAVDRTWSVGDKIGLAAVTESYSNLYKNACYVLDSEVSTTSGHFVALDESHEILLKDDEEVMFTAYGPYQTSSDAATLPSDEGYITVDVSHQTTSADQEAVDFIFAQATSVSGNTVNFTFKHVMSKLVIKIIAGEGLTAGDIRDEDNKFTLDGPSQTGTFYLATGTTEAAGTSSSWDLGSTMLKQEIDDGLQFSAIVFPQSFSSLTFVAEIKGEEYTIGDLKVPDDGFGAGQSYTYTITAKDTEASTTAIVTTNIN